MPTTYADPERPAPTRPPARSNESRHPRPDEPTREEAAEALQRSLDRRGQGGY